jgi:hypothetical protein
MPSQSNKEGNIQTRRKRSVKSASEWRLLMRRVWNLMYSKAFS